MKCLVTGGAGFIGSNLVDKLIDMGHSVVALDDLSSGYEINLEHLKNNKNFKFIKGDITDEELLKEATHGAEAVFHMAASVGNKRSIDNPLLDADINVIGTLKLLEACKRAACRKIVFSSSAGIFGELKTLPIKEDHIVEPDSPYGATKLCAEKLCLCYAKLYDIEAIALRYFNVFGPRQRFDAYGNVIPIFVFQLLRGEELSIFGDGEQTRDFVHSDDVVQANIKAAMNKGVSGAFNIASATRITINKLVQMIGEAAGVEVRFSHKSERPGDVRHSLADISAAKKAFGYEPSVDLKEGLFDYVAWAREEVRNERR